MKRKTESTSVVQVDERVQSLETCSRPELIAQWKALFGTRPPRSASRDLLCRALAWEMQARVRGGLRPAIQRQIAVAGGRPGPAARQSASCTAIKPGATLLRQWRGRMHSVFVKEDGFEYDGRPFRSLSHIAKKITGSHRSGPRFFGLRGRLSADEQL